MCGFAPARAARLPRGLGRRSARALLAPLPASRRCTSIPAWRRRLLVDRRGLLDRRGAAVARGAAAPVAVGAARLAGWIVLWPLWIALVDLRDRSPWLLLAARAHRVDRRHRRLLRRDGASASASSPPPSAPARRGRASTARSPAWPLYGVVAARRGPRRRAPTRLVGSCSSPRSRRAHRGQRRGRPLRVVDEARRGREGLEQPAAGPRRRARPHRRAHLHAAGGGAAGLAQGQRAHEAPRDPRLHRLRRRQHARRGRAPSGPLSRSWRSPRARTTRKLLAQCLAAPAALRGAGRCAGRRAPARRRWRRRARAPRCCAAPRRSSAWRRSPKSTP